MIGVSVMQGDKGKSLPSRVSYQGISQVDEGMKEPKFKLFRNVNIKVFWIDPITKKEKSGILWNYIWLDSILAGEKEIKAGFYEWIVRGSDGKEYTFPETDLYLDSKEVKPN